MRRTLIIVAALAVVSPVSTAQPLSYRFGVLDAGVLPGTLAQPITWTGPGDNLALSVGAGSLNPPSADLIDSIPRLRWDDYIMADPVGASNGGDPLVSGDGYSARAALIGATSTGYQPGRFVGSMFTIGDDSIGGVPAGPDGRVYLLNFTLAAGSSAPTTQGVYLAIFAEGGGQPTDNNGTVFTALKFGIQNATNMGINIGTGQPKLSQRYYYLDYIATAVPASELPASFGAGINYQVFVAQTDIPSPGGAVLALGVAGLAARRRR